MLNIPLADNAVDIVYTNQAIEPSRGLEKEILSELFRVTKNYLILIEPSYELANDEARKRIDDMGYIRDLEKIAKETLSYNVVKYEPFPFIFRPLNPTNIMIIEKNKNYKENEIKLVCPQFKCKLEELSGHLFSHEAMKIYPVINGIPCLRTKNGIIASKYPIFTSPV